MRKRLLAVLLALVMILAVTCGQAADRKFKPESAWEARRQALEVLQICGFSGEYQDEGRDMLLRWRDPIRVYAADEPSKSDLKQLDAFLLELALRVPELPSITRVSSEAEANLVIHYCKLSEMKNRIPGYVENNWGMLTYSYHNNGEIFSASIAIARDKTSQTARNHLMREELVGALGLTNNHELYTDSIRYGKWTTVQDLSEVDWLMLNMVYSPHVFAGWRWDQVSSALIAFYGLYAPEEQTP